ncbi:hypothetical protein TPA0907_05460 [Micromonospora humidisoli]|uniref:5'-methylthioadenosine/S-adenosylhomocysteine nucleosidase family protein n=1 Tax=Micromonospora sp. AKA109 TaxID=2733865 RepID=UPI0022C6BA04|nr:hypothetical protein [Micromonospora sp. AKA109]GHJ06179.1 hypothetical protein TPA0907_05460 [Micromonospora sp. AKA109]
MTAAEVVDSRHLPFAVARAAARAVRRAEHGRQAYRTVRPEGTMGWFRGRGPLGVMLVVAAHEGRLVWRGPDSFALLKPPMTMDEPYPAGGLRLLLLRIVDRRWETLCFAGPPALAVVAALGCVPLHLWRTAIVLALLGMLYVTFCVSGVVAAGFRGLLRSLRRRREGELAAESLPARQWSMPLCHETDAGRAGDLMREVSDRLSRLVVRRVRAASEPQGGQPDGVFVTEVLLCLVNGITTTAMREAVPRQQRVGLPFGVGTDVVVLEPRDQVPGGAKRTFNTASFFLWYVFGSAGVLLMLAHLVADQERRSCGDRCAGRPTGYGEALRWLGQRLLLSDPPDLRPQSPGMALLGWLVSIMALMTVPVAVVALQQVWRAADRMNKRFDEETEAVLARPKILLLVATQGEQRATLDVFRRRGAKPYLERRSPHTVHRLGTVAGAELMLASAVGDPSSSAGVAQVATSIISQWRPRYLVLVGTCFGLNPGEQALGDIAVSRQTRDVAHQAVTDVDGRAHRLDRGPRPSPSAELLGVLTAAADSWSGPAVHIGPILGATTLYRSNEAIVELRRRHPDAVAGDMESHLLNGVAATRKVEWIAVRGIADWGNAKKSDTHRHQAAVNAAEFVLHAIDLGLLSHPSDASR